MISTTTLNAAQDTPIDRRGFLQATGAAALGSGISPLTVAKLPGIAPAVAATAQFDLMQPVVEAISMCFQFKPAGTKPYLEISRDAIASGEPSSIMGFIFSAISCARGATMVPVRDLVERLVDERRPQIESAIGPALKERVAALHAECSAPDWEQSDTGSYALLVAKWHPAKGDPPELTPEALLEKARRGWMTTQLSRELTPSLWTSQWFRDVVGGMKPLAMFLSSELPASETVAVQNISDTIRGRSLQLRVNALYDVLAAPGKAVSLRSLSESHMPRIQKEQVTVQREEAARQQTRLAERKERDRLTELREHRTRLEESFDAMSGSADEYFNLLHEIAELEIRQRMALGRIFVD